MLMYSNGNVEILFLMYQYDMLIFRILYVDDRQRSTLNLGIFNEMLHDSFVVV